MTEREKLLGRVRMYDFALVEVIEYLDCHPDCEAALNYYREMRAAFDKADSVTFMDVYPAGEAPVPGVSGKTFLNVVLEHEGHPQADFVAHRVDVVPHLMDKLQPGDLVITMGAGDVTAMGPQIIDALLKARG